MIRDAAVAIGTVLGLLYVPILSVAGSPTWQRHIDQLSPMTAGCTIQATRTCGRCRLTPWQGLEGAGRVGTARCWPAAAAAVPGRVTMIGGMTSPAR